MSCPFGSGTVLETIVMLPIALMKFWGFEGDADALALGEAVSGSLILAAGSVARSI